MPLACKICIARSGLRGIDISSLPQNEEEMADHLEKVHHMPVQREGETHEECIKRFLEKYPEAKTCPECIAAGAEWTKSGPKFREGQKVKVVRLLDAITTKELIGYIGTVREIDPLPNGEFNYYVDDHYMHEAELEAE